jgi:hypothetical protein
MIPVFRNGKWISVPLPSTASPWSQRQKLQAASLYATAVSNGLSPHHAGVLAECFVNKDLYGVTYDKTIEERLKTFRV